MQTPGHVFVELYVEDMDYYLHLVRDVLGFVVVRAEEGWAELRSSHGTIILNRHDDPEPGHPFEHFCGCAWTRVRRRNRDRVRLAR